MNMEISKIADSNDINKERIIFKVLLDEELGFYGVFKSKKTGEKTVSSKTTGSYWFPDRQIKKGDLVVLYSKVGINSEKKNNDGTTSHFFYWGETGPLWEKEVDAAVLFKIDEWKYKTP